MLNMYTNKCMQRVTIDEYTVWHLVFSFYFSIHLPRNTSGLRSSRFYRIRECHEENQGHRSWFSWQRSRGLGHLCQGRTVGQGPKMHFRFLNLFYGRGVCFSAFQPLASSHSIIGFLLLLNFRAISTSSLLTGAQGLNGLTNRQRGMFFSLGRNCPTC